MACHIESSLTKRVMCGKVKGGHRRFGKAPLRWSDPNSQIWLRPAGEGRGRNNQRF